MTNRATETYVIKFSNGHCDETFETREAAIEWLTANIDNDEGEPHLSHSYCADTSAEQRTGESVYASQADCDADQNGGAELAVLYTVQS